MAILFILGLLLGAVAVVFALQNITIVTVTFFTWQLEGSLALIIGVSLLTGILITILTTIPQNISSYFKNKKLFKQNQGLEEELRKQKELTLFAKTHSPTKDELEKIEDGSIDEGSRIL